MTRRSRREIERSVEDLGEEIGSIEGTSTVVLTETIIGTSWTPPTDTDTAGGLDEGEQCVETHRIEVNP